MLSSFSSVNSEGKCRLHLLFPRYFNLYSLLDSLTLRIPSLQSPQTARGYTSQDAHLCPRRTPRGAPAVGGPSRVGQPRGRFVSSSSPFPYPQTAPSAPGLLSPGSRQRVPRGRAGVPRSLRPPPRRRAPSGGKSARAAAPIHPEPRRKPSPAALPLRRTSCPRPDGRFAPSPTPGGTRRVVAGWTPGSSAPSPPGGQQFCAG